VSKTFVGFGFGPIMSGLFAFEAHASGAFERLVVSEIDAALVKAVRDHGGVYQVNVAHPDGIRPVTVEGVDVLNPRDPADRDRLVNAIAESDEMATALPSVQIYGAGGEGSVAALIASGIRRRQSARPTVIYAAENNNDAALLLGTAIADALGGPLPESFRCVDTVIGKMSGIITDAETIKRLGLVEMTPGAGRAILVEKFNRILFSRPHLDGWRRGIGVFVEKEHLEPFEEAKLYGHNAIHALLGYLADLRGCVTIADAGREPQLLDIARHAFLDECGAAMCELHKGTGDPLFTTDGWREYAEDLLERMVNPHLNDLVERVIRDPLRKLGWRDRLVGAMRRCMEAGVSPNHLAMGAAAAIVFLVNHPEQAGALKLELPSTARDIDDIAMDRVLHAAWGDEGFEQALPVRALIRQGLIDLRASFVNA
jgi:mannitol-1-phosphate 5-dehydrogenase